MVHHLAKGKQFLALATIKKYEKNIAIFQVFLQKGKDSKTPDIGLNSKTIASFLQEVQRTSLYGTVTTMHSALKYYCTSQGIDMKKLMGYSMVETVLQV
jgi:hypothetical protein